MTENYDERNDPLEDLYEDRNQIDRQRLLEALQGVISVDRETGEPIFKKGYNDLTNKEKFVAQLLYRRAALALDEIKEERLGIRSPEAAENLGSSSSAVQNYASELNFIETDDSLGGYYIPGYALEEAIKHISNTD